MRHSAFVESGFRVELVQNVTSTRNAVPSRFTRNATEGEYGSSGTHHYHYKSIYIYIFSIWKPILSERNYYWEVVTQ